MSPGKNAPNPTAPEPLLPQFLVKMDLRTIVSKKNTNRFFKLSNLNLL
jgi:hypothetical protein